MVTQQKFLKLLFEPGEATCFASSPYDTQLALEPTSSTLWFSINPLHTSRADANVTAYRNFLIEIDSMPLKEQIAYVTSRLPVSSIVYSGSKSYHFIISLQTPLQIYSEYIRQAKAILDAVPEADKSTKNPSRLSRLPGVLRPDTKLLQELLYLGQRVPISALPQPVVEQAKSQAADKLFVTSQLIAVLEQGVDNYIANKFSGRNQFFYWLGKRCSELGQTKAEKRAIVDKFYERLNNKQSFSKMEAYSAARVKY